MAHVFVLVPIGNHILGKFLLAYRGRHQANARRRIWDICLTIHARHALCGLRLITIISLTLSETTNHFGVCFTNGGKCSATVAAMP